MKRPSILFVCLGNICRSPLAEGIATHLANKEGLDIRIDSAGTGAWHIGEAPCPNSVEVARMNGIDISGLKGRQVCFEDFSRFDHIIALDGKNLSDLQALGCRSVRKLGEFGFEGQDVPDPYFFDGFEGFEKVYEMIAEGIRNILEALKAGKL